MSPEEIQMRIERSQQKYREVTQVQKVYQEMLRDGRAFLHKNRYDVYVLHAGDTTIGLLNTDGEMRATLTFKNPRDQYSPRVARGILGYRFQTGLDFPIPIKGEFLEELKESGLTHYNEAMIAAAIQDALQKSFETNALPKELSFLAPPE